ncbi:MAG: class I SAM-dependent methyltransferase [Roseiflexaceae bacterium]|nr:class I SAM-dependent methyltransferase [Roseiflexaceae bacterium]
MEQNEMVALIRVGVPQAGGMWADLGAGTGNFAWALAELIGPAGQIHAIDRDARAISALHARVRNAPALATILPQQADITKALALPVLDGVVMANLLHFLRDQQAQLERIAALLRPGGRVITVEYEQIAPLPWIPFPLAFARYAAMAEQAGLEQIARIGTRRSPTSGRTMYAAVAVRPLNP